MNKGKKPVLFTPEEDNQLRALAQVAGRADIARQLGRPFCSIDKRMKVLGIIPLKGRSKSWAEGELERFAEDYPLLTNPALADRYGTTELVVRETAERMGLKKATITQLLKQQEREAARRALAEKQPRPPARYSNPDYSGLVDYYARNNVRDYANR